jgi:hypothetical protein
MDADEDNVSTLPRKSPSSYMTVRQTTSIRMALAVATILGIICDRRSRYPGGDAPSSGAVASGKKSIDTDSNTSRRREGMDNTVARAQALSVSLHLD